VKLYLTLERRTMLPALCPSAVPVRRVSPIVARQWDESVLTASAVPAAPVAGLAPVARVAAVVTGSAAVATGSVRVGLEIDLPVRGTEPTGVDEVRTDVTTTDENHVASAALLDQRGIRVQGTSGFSAKHDDMTAPKPNGGVRGIPPRGRPV
jgi:hypothetical protein